MNTAKPIEAKEGYSCEVKFYLPNLGVPNQADPMSAFYEGRDGCPICSSSNFFKEREVWWKCENCQEYFLKAQKGWIHFDFPKSLLQLKGLL